MTATVTVVISTTRPWHEHCDSDDAVMSMMTVIVTVTLLQARIKAEEEARGAAQVLSPSLPSSSHSLSFRLGRKLREGERERGEGEKEE